MIRFLLALSFVLVWLTAPAEAYRAVTSCPGAVGIWTAGATSVDPVIDINGNICVTNTIVSTQIPTSTGSTAVTASTTGTTLATAAAIPAVASTTSYICGFSVRSNATAAATGNATIAGTISATMNYTHWTAPLASGIGVTENRFDPCVPASAVNTAITVTSPAAGAGGTMSVTVWGYRK